MFLLDVFESIKDLVTMERAALFKKKNCGKVIADVFIVSVSNLQENPWTSCASFF